MGGIELEPRISGHRIPVTFLGLLHKRSIVMFKIKNNNRDSNR